MSLLLIRSVEKIASCAGRSCVPLMSCGHKYHRFSNVAYRHKTTTSLMPSSVSRPGTDVDFGLVANAIMMAKTDSATVKVPNVNLIKGTGDINIENNVDKNNKASLGQLDELAKIMTSLLPRFLVAPHPFNLYSKDMVFINNIRSIRVKGIGPYAVQVTSTKLYLNFKYSRTKLQLLNLVKNPEESSIKIRWRLVSKPGVIRFILFFYKFHETEEWKDGISTFYVNKEGKIYCHVCDNIDIEEDKSTLKKSIKNPLVDGGIHV